MSAASPAAQSFNGVIGELVAGRWVDPASGQVQSIPIRSLEIADTLDGAELDLIARLHRGRSIIVVSDEFTRAALGERVFRALQPLGNVREFVWKKPRCTREGVDELMAATRDAETLIAVGSGTINDSVKYGTFLTGRDYSVFATSPMSAYSTPTASVSFDGFKQSITCHSAQGVFFDLSVVAKCPPRLISAAFADVLCRTTAQVDWLLSHLLLGTPYVDIPYTLLAYDEPGLIAEATQLRTGDFDALARLTRIAAIMGVATSFTGTTHVGSMAEHMISHFIDMFAGPEHRGTSHGEQVGVATLTLSRLQNWLYCAPRPPVLHATHIPEADLRARFGAGAETMIAQTQRKALTADAAEALNRKLAAEWDAIAAQLRAVLLPYEVLRGAMKDAGCPLNGADLGLKLALYRDAVRYSRFIRDRFTSLDVADDAGKLEAFAAACE
ncbi:MAG: iron-containing alcohol dehydrogenase [Verrucomicrobiota bacterium]